jgi:RIO-like serine/threonine protein kinase
VILTDTTDFKILKAISDLKVAVPRVDKINSLVQLDPEELGARLGVLEMQGYVKTQSISSQGDSLSGNSHPSGISGAGLTSLGRRALTGNRWQ